LLVDYATRVAAELERGGARAERAGPRRLQMVGFKVSGGKFAPTWKLTGGKWVSYS